tara:strand:- start:876 stop:1676 length:801 start_codon:yes stop_codon:yes gene_type:complete
MWPHDDPVVLRACGILDAEIVQWQKKENAVTETKKVSKRSTTKKEPETLWAAVLNARNMAEPIVKDSHCSIGGGGYKYLSTETVLRECVPILSECGLVLMPQDQTFGAVGPEGNQSPVMEMSFTLTHIASGDSVVIKHSLPVENMRTPTKGCLAVRTTAFQYVIRDILALPRVEERQPEVDNPDGDASQTKSKDRFKSIAKKGKKASDKQLQYLRDRAAEAPDPTQFTKQLNERLTSQFGVTLETITSEVADAVIKQFEKKKEATT